ncbi:MAG: PAS domain S-box protein [Chromatiales bacterium]|jgi:PAS domain S-box-containing protein|nr:PAS domain S-box protein [Chromatiales bacterium]
MSFRLKIVLGLLAIQLLLAFVLVWNSLNFLRVSNEAELSNRALVIAPGLATLMAPFVAQNDLDEVRRQSEAVLSRQAIVYVRVLSVDGTLLVEAGNPDALARSFSEDLLLEDVNDRIFDVSAPIELDGTQLGSVQVGVSVEELPDVMGAARRQVATISLAGLVLSLIFSWLLSNYFARQLARLRDATRRIAAGDIGYQLGVAGHDELAQTASAFNTMSRKLATLYAQKQSALNGARRKAQELEESERRVHAVLNHAMDGIFTFDVHGVVENFNPAAERIFGYAAAEVLGARVAKLIPEPYLSEHEARIAEFMRAGDAGVFGRPTECVGQRKDGEVFPMEIDISQVELEGRHLFIAIARDVTQRHKVEADLRLAQATALESARSKFEFIANVSNEIRGPLTDIVDALGTLDVAELAPKQRARLEEIRGAGDALIVVISDMLDFSRIEAGRLELKSVDFDLWKTVQEVYHSYRSKADDKSLELAYAIQCGVPQVLRGDAGRLRQLLVNLIDNAVKFTQQGSVVLRVEVANDEDERALLRFEVRDTGAGITTGIRQRIFEIFAQPASSAPPVSYGTSGLGLTISKRLAEMMQGRIGVDSEPGQGSTFWFTASFEKPAHASNAGPASAANDSATRRYALVVAVEPERQRSLLGAIERADFGASFAADAAQALAALADERYQLVLIDNEARELLSDRDIVQLSAKLRVQGEGQRIVVIVADASDVRCQAYRAAGADSCFAGVGEVTKSLSDY